VLSGAGHMIHVHHLNKSRSHRIVWLLEELGVPYEIIKYERDPATMAAPPALKAIHPLGKSPVLRDGDETLAESGAIIEHRIDRHGTGLLPPAEDTPDYERYRYWLHFAEGSAMPPLLVKLYLSRIGDAAAPLVARVDGQIAEQLAFMDGSIARTGFFAGKDFSAADIQMSFPLQAAAARGGLDERFPHLLRLLKDIQGRLAYKAAVKRGGSDMAKP
jgi:glutathione S-transferase